MTIRAAAFRPADDDGLPDDVAVVTSETDSRLERPHPDVVRAIRYLLYRHELSTASSPLPQMIAVVSGSPGEGVTTVSRALAEVLASDRSSNVCWIDFGGASSPAALGRGVDEQEPLEKPPTSLGRAEQGEQPGAFSSEPVVKRNEHRVRLALADDRPDGKRTLPELEDLLAGLARSYRHVVFDTPPLLAELDSIGFLRHADAYILVTRQGSTSVNQARMLSDELRTIPLLGVVLNDYRSRTPRFLRRFFSE